MSPFTLAAIFYYPIACFMLTILFMGIIISKEKFDSKTDQFKILFYIIELISVVALPVIGIYTNQDKCGEHPFDLQNLFTPYMCWAFPAAAYYISRYGKKSFPPLIIFLCSSVISFGLIFCLVTTIHFAQFMLFFWFPLLGAELLSPLLCFLLLAKELKSYKKFYSEYLEKNKEQLKGGINSLFARILASNFLKRNTAIAGLLLPFVVLLQGLLFLLGQAPDSLILQFTESCGFLLSNHHSCSCGGHYLCSVAAFGNKKLVKPTRNGIRGGKLILVNRQLLIANAFENWFEDHSPRLHKLMRGTYDAMNIPADKWAQKKMIANFFYVVMKPAEWFFLLWLYLFDKKPETRIAKQYLPKMEH